MDHKTIEIIVTIIKAIPIAIQPYIEMVGIIVAIVFMIKCMKWMNLKKQNHKDNTNE